VRDSNKLAAVNAVAAFHKIDVPPVLSGLATASTDDTAFSVCRAAAISVARAMAPNVRATARDLLSLATISMTDAAVDAPDAANNTGSHLRDA
jgi:hypothetical protein